MQHNDKTVSNQGRPRAAKAAKNPYSNGHCPNSNLTPSLALRLALSLSDLSKFQHNFGWESHTSSSRNTQLSQSDLSHLPLWLDAARCMYHAFGPPEHNVGNACYRES